MNRILIDKLGKEKKEELVIELKEDINIKIDEIKYKKYIFNIYNSKINILSVLENSNDIDIEINIYKGKVSFNNVLTNQLNVKIIVNLNDNNSSIDLYNTCINTNKSNIYVRVNHNSKETVSNIYNNGVTKKEGSINFIVESFVPKNSVKSVVNQDSKIIALNTNNLNKIDPILLIDEYDSEARHAAFIGNFNSDKLFYLMSRGLSKKEARTLLLNGLLIGTLDIDDEEKDTLREKIK